MIRGLTTAASAMLAEERMQQLLSNNLANMDTPGFKASDGELLAFPAQLLERMNYGSDAGTSIGSLGTGVILQEGIPMFAQGTLQSTNNDLYVAIQDSTPSGTYAVVDGAAPAGAGAGFAATPNPAARPVSAAPATTASQSMLGQVVAGPAGRLEVNGQPVAVVDSSGKPLPGVYAAVNPKFAGSGLYASDGSPVYDSAGQPSYQYVNAQNVPVGLPGQSRWTGVSLRIGSSADMGDHSFFAVAYHSAYASGIALSRDGEFALDANHIVVDASGNAVLPIGAKGKPLVNGRIQVNTKYSGSGLFAADGSPLMDGKGQPSYRVVNLALQPIAGAKLGLVNADVTQLSPLGQGEYMVGASLAAAQVLPLLRVGTGQLKPGEIEESTVDPTSTMTQMMTVINLYQANANVLQAENTTLGLAVSDVGRVNG